MGSRVRSEGLDRQCVGGYSGGVGEAVEEVAERVGERGAGHDSDATQRP
jgi:hypothetical protein